MLPAAIVSVMAASAHRTRARGVGQPYYRVATDHAISLGNISPVNVLFQAEKNTRGTLVCAISQHDFFTFAKCGKRWSSARHVRVPLSLTFSSRSRVMAETWACSQASPVPTWLSLLLHRWPAGRRFFAVLPDRRAVLPPEWRLGRTLPAFS